MTTQYIVRKGTFDSGHRVMNERMKCFNIHGHTYLFELNFAFDTMQAIGYAIDFKEIKRVACQWIDDKLDHGLILNMKDHLLLNTALDMKSKIYTMSLAGIGEYCNPTVENIAQEIFLAMEVLFEVYPALTVYEIILYETPNCYTKCVGVSGATRELWKAVRAPEVRQYAREKGIVEYDDRKII